MSENNEKKGHGNGSNHGQGQKVPFPAFRGLSRTEEELEAKRRNSRGDGQHGHGNVTDIFPPQQARTAAGGGGGGGGTTNLPPLKRGLRRSLEEKAAKEQARAELQQGEAVSMPGVQRGLRRIQEEWDAKETARAQRASQTSPDPEETEEGSYQDEERPTEQDNQSSDATEILEANNEDFTAMEEARATNYPAEDPNQTESTPRPAGTLSDEDLVQARPVQEDDYPADLMEADPIDQEQEKRRELERQSKRKSFVLRSTLFALLCLALVIALGVGLGNQGPNLSTAPTEQPTSSPMPSDSPTNAPTTSMDGFEARLYPLLSNETVQKIQYPDSPQYEAFLWLSKHPNATTMEEWRMTQLFALATFYFAFEGEDWPTEISQSWMDYNSNECDWFSSSYGILGLSSGIDQGAVVLGGYSDMDPLAQASICDASGRLELLHLTNFADLDTSSLAANALTPSIPPEIGLLSSLLMIGLERNYINAPLSEIIPIEVAQLPNISIIRLAGDPVFNSQNITGTIPTHVGLATSLSHLDLSENRLKGSLPTEVGTMTSLKFLELDGNDLTGTIPSEFGLLTNLIWLELAGNDGLNGTLPLEFLNLTNLRVLGVPNSITIPESIRNLPGLEIETAFSSPSGGSEFPLDALSDTSIAALDLSGMGLRGSIPSELGLMTQLTELKLNDNSLSGTLPTELALLTRLGELHVQSNALSGSIPTELGLLEKVMSFDLKENLFLGSIPSELANMGRSFFLMSLDLKGNLLSGPIPTELGLIDSTMLAYIDLRDQFLSGTIPTELGRLQGVFKLSLDNNDLRGTIPSELGLLTGAKGIFVVRIGLSNNTLTGTVPQEVADNFNMKEFNASGNALSGVLPDSICRLEEETCDWSVFTTTRPCSLLFDCGGELCGCSCECAGNTDQTQSPITSRPSQNPTTETTTSGTGQSDLAAALSALLSQQTP